jgi:HSP20 family protein
MSPSGRGKQTRNKNQMSTLTQTEQRPATAGNGGPQRVTFVTPVANILETGDGYLLEAEMPGVAKDGIEVTVENGELVILGRRADKDLPGTALYRESRPVDYRRVFDLDPSIDTSKITAKMEQGILTLTLPKAEEVKPRRIQVTD